MKNFTHVVLYKKKHEDPWSRTAAMPLHDACYLALSKSHEYKIIEVRQEDNDD